MRLLRRSASVAALAVTATGCYTLQPVAGGAPAPGQRVAFDVSDVGRVALGGAIGPSISRIEGRLVRRDSAEYVLAVSSVDFFAGEIGRASCRERVL